MRKRILPILGGVLAVQVALAVVLWMPRKVASTTEPLFSGLDASQVAGLVISDNTGNSVHLARLGDGWVVPEADNYPADGQRIETALGALLAVNKGAPVTETAASHARLQVSDTDFVRKVEIQPQDGSSQVVMMGSSPGYGDSYLRLVGDDNVYEGSQVSSWDWSSSASGWVDTQYFDVPQDQIATLEITNASGDLKLTRLDSGGWDLADKPDGFVLDDTATNNLVQRAASVRLAEPLGKELKPGYGLDAPQATVTIVTDSGEQTLIVGATQADNSFVIKASTSDYVVQAAQYSIQPLVDATVESLRHVEQPVAQ